MSNKPNSWNRFPLGLLDLDKLSDAVQADNSRIVHSQLESWGTPARLPGREVEAAAQLGGHGTTPTIVRGLAAAGLNLFASSPGRGGDEFRDVLNAAMSEAAYVFAAPPTESGWVAVRELTSINAIHACHPNFAGFVLNSSIGAANATTQSVTAVDMAHALRFDGRSSFLWAPIIAKSFAEATKLAGQGMQLAPVWVSGDAGYTAFLSSLNDIRNTRRESRIANTTAVNISSAAPWVALDVCSNTARTANSSAADLSFRVATALAYGAQGIFFSGLGRARGAELSETLDTLALMMQQITGTHASGWSQLLLNGNSDPEGLHVGTIFASASKHVPGSIAAGPGLLIEELGPDLIAVVLDWNTYVPPHQCFVPCATQPCPTCPDQSHSKPPQVLLIDSTCATSPDGCTQALRTATLSFEPSVVAWGVDEADTTKGFPKCGKSRLGRNATVDLTPGGMEMLLLTIEVEM